ncbi:MAG: SGNH/GDSL hydrolase family protein [Clostridia bacterium]|nr:SGNH/GDSL hydrolase family protein [Clostridia bacterium]
MQNKVRTIISCVLSLVMVIAMIIPASAAGRDLGKKNDSVLYERSALFVGDSISAGGADNSTYYPKGAWAGRIGTVNSMDYVNASVSGSSCSTVRGENRIYKQLLEYEGNNFDYVILHGGVNDAWSLAPVGKMTAKDCFDLDKFDTTTFAGGLEEMFYYAIDLYDDARIGYIMNFQAPMCQKGTVKDMDAYFAEARKICEKWNIPYLDLYGDDQFCKNELKVDTAEFLPDYIHPNAEGYDILYPVIESWMETLSEYSAPKQTEATTKPKSITAATTQSTTEASVTEPAPQASTADNGGCRAALNARTVAVLTITTIAFCIGIIKSPRRKRSEQ